MDANTTILRNSNIILHDGSIHKTKINLLSGEYAPVFAEMAWTLTDHDYDTIKETTDILTRLYRQGRDGEALSLLRLLHGFLGLVFPEDISVISGNPEAWRYFLFQFLLDLDDVFMNLKTETM